MRFSYYKSKSVFLGCKGYKKDVFAVLLTGFELSHLNRAKGVHIINA